VLFFPAQDGGVIAVRRNNFRFRGIHVVLPFSKNKSETKVAIAA
jgi:hypothetical protein